MQPQNELRFALARIHNQASPPNALAALDILSEPRPAKLHAEQVEILQPAVEIFQSQVETHHPNLGHLCHHVFLHCVRPCLYLRLRQPLHQDVFQ
ncbi:hypothetical protein G7Y79_00002g008270 [Physcia stellaris]|nr:hypothetical protein G7Y79_00002g008270 [Physcia stellaris]